ncbi:MAG: CPBP family intramembrane metalloprotease [Betaproteobacteria bacterium]|nr:CPBP family intramembrane metalloprotease [Betaproteobacteria bacterium]
MGVHIYGFELSVFSPNSKFAVSAPIWVLAGSKVILFWSGCAVTYRLWTGRNWPDFAPRYVQFTYWFAVQTCVLLAIFWIAGLDFSSILDQVTALRADQWTAMAFFAALAAIHEEVLFRGVLQRAFTVVTASVFVAAFAQTALFSMAHLSVPLPPLAIVAYYFATGLWYSVVRNYTATLWSSVGAHFGHDLAALVVQGGLAGSYAVDGYPEAAGGIFGVATFAFAALTLIMFLMVIRRKHETNTPVG